MRYQIIQNYYAPMCNDWHSKDVRSSHGILVRACNFHCEFCNLSFQDESRYRSLSDDEFAGAVLRLMQHGNRFKFSGGEPTLDDTLFAKVSFVKQCGGYVFLDTNGSRPALVESMLSCGLIDVLGISLKGVTARQAKMTSGVSNHVMCWENPLSTIALAQRFPAVRFIVTHVFTDTSDISELEAFSELLPKTDNVYLKVNNLLFDDHNRKDVKSMDNDAFQEMISCFLEKFPYWRSRTILVDSLDAIINYSAIKFL